MEVLPTPVEIPATTSRRAIVPLELPVPAGAGREALRPGEALAGVERGGAKLVFAAEGRRQANADRLVSRAAIAAHTARREGRNRGGERFGLLARLAARHHAVGQAHRVGFA